MIYDAWRSLATSDLALLTLTVGVYYVAQWLQRRSGVSFVHPILISASAIMAILSVCDIPYSRYFEANSVIHFFLGFSVLCLAYPMHQCIKELKGQKLSLTITTFVGSVVGVVSVWGLAHLFGCEEVIVNSILTKSITSAIALPLTESIGGIPAIAMLSVVIAGVGGSIFGVGFLRLIGVKDRVAVGAALGSASHAVGTARALELGALEGAVGGVAICLMGIFTSLFIGVAQLLLA